MNQRAWTRLGAKMVHDIACIAFGGALAACLVINLKSEPSATAEFIAWRNAFAAIARYVLLPSMAVVVLSGLLALASTRAYMDAGWAWLKAALGLSVFEATLMMVGSAGRLAEVTAAAAGGDVQALGAMLRSERNTLWILLALCVANVALAVWRPKFSGRPRPQGGGGAPSP